MTDSVSNTAATCLRLRSVIVAMCVMVSLLVNAFLTAVIFFGLAFLAVLLVALLAVFLVLVFFAFTVFTAAFLDAVAFFFTGAAFADFFVVFLAVVLALRVVVLGVDALRRAVLFFAVACLAMV